MITCLGLIVGYVENTNTQDVLNQCAKFMKTYKHLENIYLEFKIDGVVYATVIDIHIDDKFYVLFRSYNGQWRIGEA